MKWVLFCLVISQCSAHGKINVYNSEIECHRAAANFENKNKSFWNQALYTECESVDSIQRTQKEP